MLILLAKITIQLRLTSSCGQNIALQIRPRRTQHNTTQHNTTQHNTTQHNTTQHNTTQHNTTQHNTTQHNTTQHNTTQHNTTQHNTTQHNTTQHTTQHNTQNTEYFTSIPFNSSLSNNNKNTMITHTGGMTGILLTS